MFPFCVLTIRQSAFGKSLLFAPNHVLLHLPVQHLLEIFPHNLPRDWGQANMPTVSPILLLGGAWHLLFLLPKNLSHDHRVLKMSEKTK